MTLLSELETELKSLQGRKAGFGLPPPGSAPSTAPALSKPRLGPAPEPESEVSSYTPTDTVGSGFQAVKTLFGGQGLKKRDYAYAYGAGAGGLVSNAGKAMGVVGREVQKLASNDSPVLYAAEKAYEVMKDVNPMASAMGKKGVQIARDVKASRQVEDPDPLVREAQKPKYKLINTLGEKLESAEKPTMATGKRTKEFYDNLLSDGARELKNTPWYKAEGLGAKFLSASLQATESAPMMAVTAVAGAPIAGTLKATGATKALGAGIQRLGVGKKWAGKTADWLSEGLAYSTPEGILAGLANAEEVGNEITKKTHDELMSSPKYLEYFNSTPGNLDLDEREGIAKQLLIEDAEVFALGSTCAASMATGMLAGGGIFGSAGASPSFIMRRVMGFAKEGVQEFFQSGPGEKLPANIALKLFADPEQEIMKDVWAAAAAGAGPGALIGGFVGSGVKPSSPAEVLDTARAERLKLRDDSMRALTTKKISDDKLLQMMKSPEALAGYGLVPSDLQGLITNRARAQQELADFNESLAAAPSNAVRQGMKSSFTGEVMGLLQEQIQPGRPDDGQKAEPETRQTSPETKEKGAKGRSEVAIAKAQERVLDILSKKTTLNLSDPKVMETFDTELKKAYEELGIAQEQAETGDRRVDVGLPAGEERRGDADRRADPERRKRIEDMTPVELKKELLTNPLTGIPNRRAMEEAMQRADDEGKPKSVIFIDADSLKTINDLGGHEAGDALLKALADSIKTVDPDLGCHISGDEFVILADNPAQAKEKAAKLDKILATKEIVFTLENGDEFTYSGLGASYGIAKTLKEADRRMGLHKTEREKTGERVGRGETPPGLRKTASGKGEVGISEGQEKGLLGEEEKEGRINGKSPEDIIKEQQETKKLIQDSPVVKALQVKRTKVKQKLARVVKKGGTDVEKTSLEAQIAVLDTDILRALDRAELDAEMKVVGSVPSLGVPGSIDILGRTVIIKLRDQKAFELKAAKKAITDRGLSGAQAGPAAGKGAETKATTGAKKDAAEKKESLPYPKDIESKSDALVSDANALADAIDRKATQYTKVLQNRLIERTDTFFKMLSTLTGVIPVRDLRAIVKSLNHVQETKIMDEVNRGQELKNNLEHFSALLWGTPETQEEKQFSQILRTNSDALVALKWVAEHSDSLAHRTLAKHISEHALMTKLVVFDTRKRLPQGIPIEVHKARGLWDSAASTVYLRDSGEKFDTGLNEIVFLHEMVHAVTVTQVFNMYEPGFEKDTSTIEAKKLNQLYQSVMEHLSATNNIEWNSRVTDLTEFVAYGLTEPKLQEVMRQMPVEKTTAWNKFVRTIAQILGVKDHMMLGEFLQVSSDLMSAPLRGLEAAKKRAKENMAKVKAKAEKERAAVKKKAEKEKAATLKAADQEAAKQRYLGNIAIVDRQLKNFEKEPITGARKTLYDSLKAERQRYVDAVNELFPGTVEVDPDIKAKEGEHPEFVALLNKTKSGKVALQWIAKNSKIASYREIAKRMLFHLPKVPLVIVRKSNQAGVPWQIAHSKGLHVTRNDTSIIFLKDFGILENRGLNELVFLHEMIHAATVSKIRRATSPKLKSSKLRTDVKRLDVLYARIINYLKDPANHTSSGQRGECLDWVRRVNNTKELISYGMTDPGFQEILSLIPFEKTTVWKKFVNVIADILGISDHTALGELVRITDAIVAAKHSVVPTSGVSEAAKGPGLEAFKKWFGDSSVVDEKGAPLVVYHGTRQGQFQVFEGKYRKHEQLGFGLHFAENQGFADRYAKGDATARKGKKPYVFKGYLSIQNMLKADAIVLEGSPEFALALKLAGKSMHTSKNEAGVPGVYLQNVIDSTSPQRAERLIKEAGYDGVQYKAKILQRDFQGARKVDESTSYLVFTPNQIKSVDNVGTFDPESSDVDMMTIDDLPPDQKKLFEEAFGTLVKQPVKTQVRRMQEEEHKVLKAAKKSRDPEVRKVAEKLTALNRSSTAFKRTGATQTVGWLDKLLGLPEYSFAKDEAANRVMQVALKADEVKHTIQTGVTGDFGKAGERIQRDNPKAYKRAMDVLIDMDKSGIGFSIAQDEGTWNVVGIAGEILEGELEEATAIQGMVDAEQAFLLQQGHSADELELIKEFRGLTNRAFDVQVADLRQQLTTAERYGLEEPRIAGEGTPTISEAIATIGDLRGTYFPRERPNRTYIIRASKEGEDNVLLTYDGYLPENTESWDISNKIKEVINMGLPISKQIRELQAKGYEVTGPTLSPAPSEAVFDAPGIAASLDAFLHLAETSSKDEDSKAIQHLNRMLVKKVAELYKAKGSLSSRLHRVEDYTTGFETDPLKAALSHAQRVASGVTKRQTARDMILCFTGRDISFSEYLKMYPGKKYMDYRKFVAERRVDPTEQQALYKNTKDYIHYALESNTSADRALGYMKAAAVFMYLGFRIPSAAVNLTNMVMAVPATIAAHSDIPVHQAFKEVTNAGAVYAAYRSNQLMHHGMSESLLGKVEAQAEAMAKKVGKTLTGKVKVTSEDAAIFDDISSRGWDQAHFNIEALKALQGYSGKTFNDVMSASMYMFGAAEKANRATTIFAAYKAAEAKAKANGVKVSHEDLMNQAHHTSDRAHGIYGKAAKPFLVQKYKALDLFYTFLKFQHNYMLNMLEVGIKYKNLPAALHMLLIPAVLSGAGATMATPVIATLAQIFGDSDDPEEDVYAWTERHLPETMQRMARHGAFGLLNLNFKGSLQMNNPFPTKLSELAGAPGAVIIDVWEMAKHFRYREWSKGVEKIAPTFAETPIKGYRFYTEGVTTKTYSPAFYGEEQLKADELELFMMMFSFNTARLSGIREKQWKEKNVKGSFSTDRQTILRKLKKIKMSSDPDNIKALARVQEEIDEFNLRVEHAPSRYQVNYLTWSQINSNLKRAMKPSKFEKRRASRVD